MPKAKKKSFILSALPHLSKWSCIYDFFQWDFFFNPQKYMTLEFSYFSENYF